VVEAPTTSDVILTTVVVGESLAKRGGSLEHFVEVGAGYRRWLTRAGGMNIDVLGLAREQLFECDVLERGGAKTVALGVGPYR
jgi:hypothetical protein